MGSLRACISELCADKQDHVGSVEAVKADDRDEQVKIAGGSVIIDPLGDILAGPLRGREEFVTDWQDYRSRSAF